MGPVAIGGVGGSGTRLVAAIVKSAGMFIGDNLNEYNDNLDFPGPAGAGATARQPLSRHIGDAAIAAFLHSMRQRYERDHPGCIGWGWKNGTVFLFLDEFAAHVPDLRYVHVIRHGLDMALSRNTRQVRLWGHVFGIEYGVPTRTASALDYWVAANEHALDTAPRLLDGRVLVVNFDDLCADPRRSVAELAAFVGAGAPDLDALAALVRPPATMGRHRKLRYRRRFSAEDAARVARFGFDVPRP